MTVQATLARVDVKIDFDKAFNFKAVRTWGWNPAGAGDVKMARTKDDDPDAMKKRAEPPILDAVTTEMTRLGLKQAPDAPDLTVTYYLLLSTSMSTQTMGQFVPGAVAWGLPLFPQATQSLKILNRGSLVLDLSAKGTVVWRGVAQAEIKMDARRQEARGAAAGGRARSACAAIRPSSDDVREPSAGRCSWIVACLVPAVGAAQDLTPRAYFPLPVSSNAIILTYAFSDGELVFDPTLPITDATGTIHTPVVSLYHAFDLFGRFGQRDRLAADSRDRRSARERSAARSARSAAGGWPTPSCGWPSTSPGARRSRLAEFVKTPPSRVVLGASVKVVAPTGQYDPTRLINIGTNRWAFKPELGYTGTAGRFVLDAFAGIWLFTAERLVRGQRSRTRGGATRTQDPIGAFELHVSYDVKPRLWISADVNYWRGGRTSVNGVEGTQTLQANSRLGLTGSVPLTRRQSLKISYSDGVIVRIGGNFRVLSTAGQYGWVGKP